MIISNILAYDDKPSRTKPVGHTCATQTIIYRSTPGVLSLPAGCVGKRSLPVFDAFLPPDSRPRSTFKARVKRRETRTRVQRFERSRWLPRCGHGAQHSS